MKIVYTKVYKDGKVVFIFKGTIQELINSGMIDISKIEELKEVSKTIKKSK